MNLIIDIGNTFTKYFVIEKNEIIHHEQKESSLESPIDMFLDNFPQIKGLIISSVVTKKYYYPEVIKNRLDTIILLDEKTPIPVNNHYKTPETLGKDRIAAIVGAHNIFPNQNVLAIDAGTAIKFDFINKNGDYFGGNISPGLSMRFKALNHYTSRLPLLSAIDNHAFFGSKTSEAIIAGVQNGIIFEIDGYINRLKEQYKQLKVILTGGDSFFFAGKLKNRIFAKPFLVALGLNRILEYNVKKL